MVFSPQQKALTWVALTATKEDSKDALMWTEEMWNKHIVMRVISFKNCWILLLLCDLIKILPLTLFKCLNMPKIIRKDHVLLKMKFWKEKSRNSKGQIKRPLFLYQIKKDLLRMSRKNEFLSHFKIRKKFAPLCIISN